jgi:hypothetical protein
MSKKQNISAKQELESVAKQIDNFKENVESLTLDRMNAAPRQELELQTKLSSREIEKSREFILKPKRTVSSKEKFNENHRSDYEYASQRVRFIAENNEIIGETITMWTKPFPGMPAEEWDIPTNKPVVGPRYVAEQLKKCRYHRLIMEETRQTGSDYAGTYVGTMIADTTKQRLDAHPVGEIKSVFMNAGGF